MHTIHSWHEIDRYSLFDLYDCFWNYCSYNNLWRLRFHATLNPQHLFDFYALIQFFYRNSMFEKSCISWLAIIWMPFFCRELQKTNYYCLFLNHATSCRHCKRYRYTHFPVSGTTEINFVLCIHYTHYL